MEDRAGTPSTPASAGRTALPPTPAHRLASLLASGAGALERLISERRAAGGDVISLAAIEPGLPPPAEATAQLANALKDAQLVRGAGGLTEYRAAVARWYQSRFKISLDPNREVLPLTSIEDGIVGLAQLLLDPDDAVLVPDPARPIYHAALALAGGVAISLPLRPEEDFLPEIKAVSAEAAAKARMLWLDYPNLPTGAVAPASFFHQVVQFAQEYDILIVHVADFSEFTYDGYRTISLLEIPGARRVCVELHSPALTYNLPGWPGAVAVGNADVLRLFRQLRQRLRHLTFVPVQRALAETMMVVGADWVAQRNGLYQGRRDQLIAVLEHLGLHVRRPKAVPSVWAGVPSGYSSSEVVELLASQAGVVAAAGDTFGPRGEGYIHVSLTTEESRFQEALSRLRQVTIPARDVMPPGETEEAVDGGPAKPAQTVDEEHEDAG